MAPVSPRLANIRLHPIKSLDPVHVTKSRIGPGGGLEFDRAWALYSADGQWVNGKRTAAVHLIRAAFAPDIGSAALSVPGDSRKIPTKTFAFPSDTAAASQWFSDFFEQPITVRHSPEGFPDDDIASGHLFGEDERSAVRFRVGEVNFEGSNPCARCPVPPRDPRTGEIIPGFQKRLSDFRRTNIPSWTPEARFDHYYRLATNTRIGSTESGKILRAGDSLVLL